VQRQGLKSTHTLYPMLHVHDHANMDMTRQHATNFVKYIGYICPTRVCDMYLTRQSFTVLYWLYLNATICLNHFLSLSRLWFLS